MYLSNIQIALVDLRNQITNFYNVVNMNFAQLSWHLPYSKSAQSPPHGSCLSLLRM